VLFRGAVFRRDQISAEVARFEAEGADLMVVVHLTYSPSQLALPALQRTRLPILLWNTQELRAVDDSFSVAAMIDNHGVHGTQDLANVLVRSGVQFSYVTSHLEDAHGLTEVGDFVVAAAAVAKVKRMRIGLLGYAFPGMGDFAVDTTHLAGTLGCAWEVLTVEEYIQRSASVDRAAVDALVASYRSTYAVAENVTAADLEATARAELALRSMVQDRQLDALTYQFLAFGDDERTSTLPFVAASRLMADGIGFGGEGDLIAAAGTSLLHWLQPPATFSEVFTIDFAGNALFMSHMGEANVAMARRDRKVPLVARPTPITRTRDGQLALVTSLEPGPATFMALTLGHGGRWQIIASAVEVEDYGPLPSMCVPHFKIKPSLVGTRSTASDPVVGERSGTEWNPSLPTGKGDVRQFLNAYARAGGPHHNAICFGDARRKLALAAELLNADYIEI
jgi:L-arabinose isomerase